MTINYQPKGTCSQQMTIEVEDGIVKSLQVQGGCHAGDQQAGGRNEGGGGHRASGRHPLRDEAHLLSRPVGPGFKAGPVSRGGLGLYGI